MRLRSVAIGLGLLLIPALCEAGAWTQPQGRLWLKIAGIAQESDQFYAESRATLPDGRNIQPGDARPYDNGGLGTSRLVWSELEYGLTGAVTLGLQVPYYDLRYEDDLAIHRSFGIGDLRVTSRVALWARENRVTARVAWKLPTGPTSQSPDVIPIGDGQADLELGLQLGRGLGRALSWVGAEGGFRYRRLDAARDWDPGDEWFWLVEAGYGLVGEGRVGVKAAYTGTRGDEVSLNFFSSAIDLSRNYDRLDLTLIPLRADVMAGRDVL